MSATAVVTALLAGCRPFAESDSNVDSIVGVGINTVGKVDFNQHLMIPPLATSTLTAGRRIFDDVQFQILDIGGSAAPPELSGWKDTVYLRPQTHYRLIMRFTDYTDSHMPYMYHCHLLWHEDNGMMGQFVVVES